MKRFLILIVLLLSQSSLSAATIHVPTDQTTIQAAIDAAAINDTVLVAPGTYTGDGNRDISFNGKNLVLMSETGAETTIIDCQASSTDMHYAIKLANGEDTTSLIDGFTITNAHFREFGWPGGALYFTNGTANIQNCIVSNCGTVGIFLSTSNFNNPCRVSDCIIEGNGIGLLQR